MSLYWFYNQCTFCWYMQMFNFEIQSFIALLIWQWSTFLLVSVLYSILKLFHLHFASYTHVVASQCPKSLLDRCRCLNTMYFTFVSKNYSINEMRHQYCVSCRPSRRPWLCLCWPWWWMSTGTDRYVTLLMKIMCCCSFITFSN